MTEKATPDVGPLSHTGSLRQPLRGPPLRSGPLRGWLRCARVNQ